MQTEYHNKAQRMRLVTGTVYRELPGRLRLFVNGAGRSTAQVSSWCRMHWGPGRLEQCEHWWEWKQQGG